MVYVLTVDQLDSRHRLDAVDAALTLLAPVSTAAPFERTAGDEFQGVLTDAWSVARAMVVLVEAGGWHIGIGAGPVTGTVPESSRRGRGPAFLAARQAVERAKQTGAVQVKAPGARAPAADATAGCQLLADLLQRRTEPGREAVELARRGLTQAEIGQRIGITRQAVGERLRTARWSLEQAAMPMLAHLLSRAHDAAEGEAS